MKKLTLLFTAIFASAMMFAQVGNVSTIDQSTNRSQVAVDQYGNDNTSGVTQQYGQYHEAIIDQIGDDNVSTLLQDNTNTYTKVYQEGDRNTSDIFQRSRLFVGAGNVASYISLEQLGDDNDAYIHQDAEAGAGGTKTNWAEAIQDGNSNTLEIWQDRPGDIAAFNEAIVDQDGSFNFGFIDQFGDGNWSKIRQQHSSNIAWQYVEGDNNTTSSNVHGTSNYTYQSQVGDGNWSYLAASPSAASNTLTSYQDGDDNYNKGRVAGSGSTGNTMMIDQDGYDNKSYNLANGDFNSLDVFQDGTGNVSGTHVTYGVSQIGDYNTADVDQIGDYNTSTITQTGNWNTSTVLQH